jgi:transposase InsO family protein
MRTIQLIVARQMYYRSIAVFNYIEVFYNRQRRHSELDYVSPVEFERDMTQRETA